MAPVGGGRERGDATQRERERARERERGEREREKRERERKRKREKTERAREREREGEMRERERRERERERETVLAMKPSGNLEQVELRTMPHNLKGYTATDVRAAALLLEVLNDRPEVLGELFLGRGLVLLRGRASKADVLVEVGADARVEGRELPVELRVDHGALLRVRRVQRLELVLVADVAPDRMRLPAGRNNVS